MKPGLKMVLASAMPVIFALLCISHGFGESYKYDPHGKRDPFVPLVGIDRPAASRLEDVTSISDIRLEGIATRSKGALIAVLNGEIVKVGDKFGNITIRKITKKAVTIDIDGKSFDKSLAE